MMPIPFADDAVVPIEKVTDYLLNVHHPVGGTKAIWFLGCGYQQDVPDVLIEDLLSIATSCKDFVEQPFVYGVKYVAVGEVTSPTGAPCKITTVWKLLTNSTAPSFVTAYPA